MDPSEEACAQTVSGERSELLKTIGAALRQSEEFLMKIGGILILAFFGTTEFGLVDWVVSLKSVVVLSDFGDGGEAVSECSLVD